MLTYPKEIRRTLCILVAFSFGISGCTAPPPTGIRITAIPLGTNFQDSPLADLRLSGEEYPSTPVSHKVTLSAANNETASFRFVIRTTARPLPAPALTIAPLVARNAAIDSSVAQIFRMHRVEAPALPGWHIRFINPSQRVSRPLDVLVPTYAPRGGVPATFEANSTYHFWVDLNIPKGTNAGVYHSRIILTSRGIPTSALDLQLTVHSFVLPDIVDTPAIVMVRPLNSFHYDTDSASSGAGDVAGATDGGRPTAPLLATMRMLRAHGLTPVLDQASPTVKLDSFGRLTVDWKDYDRLVEPYLNGQAFLDRKPLPFWPMPSAEPFARTGLGESGLPSMDETLLGEFLRHLVNHFDEKGWIDRSYTLVPTQNHASPHEDERTQAFARVARSVDSRITVASTSWPQSMEPYGWTDYLAADFGDAVDLWVCPAGFYDPDALTDYRDGNSRRWLSIDRPPFSGSTTIFAPASYQRVLSWQAYRLGAEAFVIGSVDGSTLSASPQSPQACLKNDPATLIYPGAVFGLNEPVASVRLKHLRASMQDAAYRKLLGKHGLTQVAKALGQSLSRYAGAEAYRTHFADGKAPGWPIRISRFDLAREIMAEELNRLSAGERSADAGVELARSGRWRRFMLATRRAHVEVIGTRLYVRGTKDERIAEAEVTVRIENTARTSMDGRVGFETLPSGWRSSSSATKPTQIPAGESKSVTITARTNTVPTGAGGLIHLPIEVAAADGERYLARARVTCLTATPCADPPTIDGDLSDWPLGELNVASNFQLIGGASFEGFQTPTATPTHQTIALVMRHKDDLFIAINSRLGGSPPPPSAARNRVSYDDLVPIGEELVEILFDPTNAGTRSPEDLFHIAVKSSGAYLTEKGIRLDPPSGARSAWRVDMDVATRIRGDRWIVELRIPLGDFGDVNTHQVFWGFNVTRFDQSREEFSNWSGAVLNAYDPLALGNLYLP